MHRGLWLLLALAVAGGGLALWLTMDARFYIYSAQISGNRRLSQEAIFETSGLRGLHILWARSATIESRILEAFPSLASVNASCQLPSACTISVVERRPRVIWDEGTAALGETWWIDEEGNIFSDVTSIPGSDDAVSTTADADGRSTDLASTQGWEDVSERWVVTGPLPRDKHGQLDEEVRVALAEIWESGKELPSEFRYTPEQGLSFIDEHGWQIVLGKGAGVARRLQVLTRLVAHLEARGVTPRFVDVRFPESPYYVAAE
jgi:hypothetical protein